MPRLTITQPLALGILKGLVPRIETKCIDLNVEFREQWAAIFVEKWRSKKLEDHDYERFKRGYSAHGKLSLYYRFHWLSINYGFKLLEGMGDSIDMEMEALLNKMTAKILMDNPEVVCFSVDNASLPWTLHIARALKADGIKIVIGGPGTANSGGYLLNDYNFIDAVVVGEAESVFKAVLETLNEKIPIQSLWRGRCLVDLNKMPLPNYDDLNMAAYELVGIETNRGCIGRCAFCNIRFTPFSEKLREKSAKRVLTEIQTLRQNGKLFYFCVNTVNTSKKRVRELATALNAENIQWRGPIYPKVDREMARLLKQSGCCEAELGIESFSNHVLSYMYKGTNLRMIVKSLQNLKAEGIKTRANIFFRFPGESVENLLFTLLCTLRYREYLDGIGFGYYKMVPNSIMHKSPEHWNLTVIPGNERWIAYNNIVPYVDQSRWKKLVDMITVPFIELFIDFLANLKEMERNVNGNLQ